jgi:alkylation response protein AidB-like acyl-CoA dehydrogenase
VDQGRLADLLGSVRARRDEIELLGRLPDDIAAGLKTLGIYRALVPASLGGGQWSPGDFLALIETIAAADGSVGWVASFAGAVVYLAGLPEHRFEQLYADGPDIAFAAGLFPPQRATREGDRLRISGRWQFASGCSGADWLGVGITVEESGAPAPKPRMLVFPRALAEQVPDWSVMGLAGTGSYDLILRDAMIDADWSFVRGGGTSRAEPIYHFPVLPFSALNHAIVAVGAAMAALDEAVGAPRPSPGDHAGRLAGATAGLWAARSFLYRQTEAVWRTVLKGGPVPIAEASALRLAANQAAGTAIAAARAAFDLVDPDAADVHRAVGRHLRDAYVVSQHAFLSPAMVENGGRVLLGMDPPPGYL